MNDEHREYVDWRVVWADTKWVWRAGLGWAAAADNRALTRSPISLNHTHRCREELVGEIVSDQGM